MERKYFGCARFPTDETGDVLFKPAEGRRNWRERGGNAENNTRRCVSRMEASHPTRDVSITRVINARASHRCTRSLEIGLFNGKACNDPRGERGRGGNNQRKKKKVLHAKNVHASQVDSSAKKKLYSFISIHLFSLSFFPFFDAIRGTWRQIKS